MSLKITENGTIRKFGCDFLFPLAVSTQYTNVTDRHPATAHRHMPCLCIASRGKNRKSEIWVLTCKHTRISSISFSTVFFAYISALNQWGSGSTVQRSAGRGLAMPARRLYLCFCRPIVSSCGASAGCVEVRAETATDKLFACFRRRDHVTSSAGSRSRVTSSTMATPTLLYQRTALYRNICA